MATDTNNLQASFLEASLNVLSEETVRVQRKVASLTQPAKLQVISADALRLRGEMAMLRETLQRCVSTAREIEETVGRLSSAVSGL